MIIKALGKQPSGKDLERIQQSPNYRGGQFQSAEPAPLMLEDVSYVRMVLEFTKRPKRITPSRPLPSVKADLLAPGGTVPSVTWFGHSSYLIKYQGKNILVDPVLFGGASPLSFIGKPFDGAPVYTLDELPDIDLLIITHDHYDHLSYRTLMAIKNKIHKIVAPLGVGSHLAYWGFDRSTITELDWGQSASFEPGIAITATPAKHFSGRFISRGKTLWTSYVLELGSYKIYLDGDSGFGGQYKIAGTKYGPFDLAILENGQYGKNWPFIHKFPEQTAQAARDLRAKVVLPVHWAKFILASHNWNEPVRRLLAAADGMGYQVVTPKLGSAYIVGDHTEQDTWWDFDVE